MTIPHVTEWTFAHPVRRYPIVERRLESLRRTDRLRQLSVADLGQYRAVGLRRLLDRFYDPTPPPPAAAAAAVPDSQYARLTLGSRPSDQVVHPRPAETRVLHRAPVPDTPASRGRRGHQHGECLTADPQGQRLWCRSCAAAYLGLQSKTLANWNYEASPGPQVRGRKGTPRYRKSDLDLWTADIA